MLDIDFYKIAKDRHMYDHNTGIITNKRTGNIAGCRKSSDGYIYMNISSKGKRKCIMAHRLAWFMFYGEVPNELDHINRLRDDNSIKNLRLCTRIENSRNRSKRIDNTSGVTGVHYNKKTKKWDARININRKRIKITSDVCPAVAVSKRKIAEFNIFREFKPVYKELVK